MSGMIAEYEAAYPPETFYEYEGRTGTWDAPYESPEPPSGAPLTRADVEAAEAELAAALGTSAEAIRAGALELCGLDSRGNTTFVSLAQHAGAVAQLAMGIGVTSGYSDADGDAAAKVAEIAERQPVVQYTRRDGTRAARYLIDPYKAGRALAPAPERFVDDTPEPALSAAQEDEIIRLTSTDLRKPTYPLRRGPRDKGAVSLSQARRETERLIELAADGSTRTYTSNNGSVTVTEADTTEPGQSFTDDEIDAEVARFHNMASQLFGVTPQNDAGNRSYPPGPQSAWGQRTQPGASWFSGQG
jgi:hypothetical protein